MTDKIDLEYKVVMGETAHGLSMAVNKILTEQHDTHKRRWYVLSDFGYLHEEYLWYQAMVLRG